MILATCWAFLLCPCRRRNPNDRIWIDDALAAALGEDVHGNSQAP
jgi:hypothetical protein